MIFTENDVEIFIIIGIQKLIIAQIIMAGIIIALHTISYNISNNAIKKYIKEEGTITLNYESFVYSLIPLINLLLLIFEIVWSIKILKANKKNITNYSEVVMYMENKTLEEYKFSKIVNMVALSNREEFEGKIKRLYREAKEYGELEILNLMFDTLINIYENEDLDTESKNFATKMAYKEFESTIKSRVDKKREIELIENEKKEKEKEKLINEKIEKILGKDLIKISEELKLIRES